MKEDIRSIVKKHIKSILKGQKLPEDFLLQFEDVEEEVFIYENASIIGSAISKMLVEAGYRPISRAYLTNPFDKEAVILVSIYGKNGVEMLVLEKIVSFDNFSSTENLLNLINEIEKEVITNIQYIETITGGIK